MKRPGDVVIINMSRSTSGQPRPRPVLLLREITSSSGDWLACMISARFEFLSDEMFERIDLASQDYFISGLLGASAIRYTRLAVISDKMMTGKIGEISADRLMRIRIQLGNWLKD